MSPKVINIAVILILLLLSLAMLANSMTKPLSHDEQMYCTSGVLLAQEHLRNCLKNPPLLL